MTTCIYTKVRQDGWGADWQTGCGETVHYEAPETIGFSFPPTPTECGTYCTHCGGKIMEQT